MKTLIMFTALMSLTSAQVFQYTYPTMYTIDILEQPAVPGFLNDYSAPGQVQWNQQVNWELNRLENLIEEIRPYREERIEFYPIREIQTQECDYHTGTTESYWFQTKGYKKKVLFDF